MLYLYKNYYRLQTLVVGIAFSECVVVFFVVVFWFMGSFFVVLNLKICIGTVWRKVSY